MSARRLRRLCLPALAILLTMGLAAPGADEAAAQSAEADATYSVSGLSAPAEILVDSWGLPHIYAEEHYDAFFAQGFNAARDRLWQIDLWRKRGLGQLAEEFGPAYVEQDRANRLFQYRGDMYWEWLAYGNDAKRISEAFTAGINAYIGLAKENDELMPWEFQFLGYEPEPWEPEDVVRLRSHAIVSNLGSEVERAYFVRDFGFQYQDLRAPLTADWETEVPEGLDLSVLPDDSEDLLRVYDLATSGVSFDEEDLSGLAFGEATVDGQAVTPDVDDAAAGNAATDAAGGDGEIPDWAVGSNTFVVAPERTATDGPLIASDPHRSQGVPSLRYMAHLNAPELNVIGAGEPGLPGISLGHNEDIAFGLTIFRIDQEDLYVYETNPENPDEYRYEGRWVPMQVEPTEIAVRGQDPVQAQLKFTRHGPVIYEDPERNLAFAVRTVWTDPGTAAYFGSIEYMRAENWRQFLNAMNRWGTPAENQQYADVEGNIGWKPGGRTPIRPNWDGLLPVPGDGTYEWSGFYDMDQLPVEFNPERGWIQTNNEMRLFDHVESGVQEEYLERKISFEWSAPWRALRTREVLADMDDATIESMLALQTDHLSIPGRRITAELAGVTADDERVQDAIALLTGWDHVMDNDSAAAALFDVWAGFHGAAPGGDLLGRALLERAVDDPEAVERIGSPDQTSLVDMVERPERWFDGDAVATRNAAMVESLAQAVAQITEDQGADPSGWRFGFYNQQSLEHPLSDLVDFRTRAAIDLGPRERTAVNNTVGDQGASWRYVAEPGNWDEAIAMSNPGQSGDPESPYYDNLWEPWLRGDVFPLVFGREAVEANTERRIELVPGG